VQTLKNKNKNKNKNMQKDVKGGKAPLHFDFSLVYIYLLTGILLFISVFLFLPKVAVG